MRGSLKTIQDLGPRFTQRDLGGPERTHGRGRSKEESLFGVSIRSMEFTVKEIWTLLTEVPEKVLFLRFFRGPG
jgi:hypothetical protein